MASLTSLGFVDKEAESEGQFEFSFLPGFWGSPLSPWGIMGVQGAILLVQNIFVLRGRFLRVIILRSVTH